MAEKDKVFYWIKLRKEFMNSETIDFLMSQKNGANYVVLYQMLIMQTLNTEGKLCNVIGECIVPFNAEKIQRDCKWFDIDTVRVAMELYAKLGLIYKNEDDILTIADFDNMVGSETYWAKIKRLQRENKDVGQFPTNVQNPLISNISNLKSNNIDNNIERNNIKEKEPTHKYGEYGWIKLTDTQYSKLCEEHTKDYIDFAIQKIDEYIQSNGNKNKYKDWNLVLRKAIRDNWSCLNDKDKTTTNKPKREIDIEKEKQYGGLVF